MCSGRLSEGMVHRRYWTPIRAHSSPAKYLPERWLKRLASSFPWMVKAVLSITCSSNGYGEVSSMSIYTWIHQQMVLSSTKVRSTGLTSVSALALQYFLKSTHCSYILFVWFFLLPPFNNHIFRLICCYHGSHFDAGISSSSQVVIFLRIWWRQHNAAWKRSWHVGMPGFSFIVLCRTPIFRVFTRIIELSKPSNETSVFKDHMKFHLAW